MKNCESEEMYLETILLLCGRKANVRSVDIVETLHYAKSSVSRAVNLLQSRGYIVVAKSGYITLTQAGREKASRIYERHRILTDALVKIGADRTEAEANACRIEHVITPELFAVIKRFVNE